MMKNLFEGKKGLIFGLANERSIAYSISKFLHEQGAQLSFGYQNIFENRVKTLTEQFSPAFVHECDVTDDFGMIKFFDRLFKVWNSFDFLVHAIAFADKNQLNGRYVETTRNCFLEALNISCYSFTKLVQLSEKFMIYGGSCLTLSYYGAKKRIPNYNVMGVAKAALESSVRYLASDMGPSGIRINAISAGPIRTLASSGIADFKDILQVFQHSSPLRKIITSEDVAKAAAFLLSYDLSGSITGEIMNVDCGYNTVGVTNLYNNEYDGQNDTGGCLDQES